jgi:hypothetical protein
MPDGTTAPTVDFCVEKTRSLLEAAELEPTQRQNSVTRLAGVWLDLAAFIDERETLGDV